MGFLPAPDWEAPPTFFPKGLFEQEASDPPHSQDSPCDTQPWLRQEPEASLWFPTVTGHGNVLLDSGFWPKRERGSLGRCLGPDIWPAVRMQLVLPRHTVLELGSICSLVTSQPVMKSFHRSTRQRSESPVGARKCLLAPLLPSGLREVAGVTRELAVVLPGTLCSS